MYLDDAKMREFMTHLRENTRTPPKMIGEHIRMKLRELFENTFGLENKNALHKLYPYRTLKKGVDRGVKELKEDLSRGDVFLTLVNGEPASLGCIEKFHYDYKDGRPVYELAKGVTLPKFKWGKLNKKNTDMRFEEIRKRHPDSPIMFYTRSEALKKRYRLLSQWEEIGEHGVLEQFNVGREVTPEEIAALKKECAETGYTAFLFDPMKQEKEQIGDR